MTYAMQPTERGESSAMAAARGEKQNIPTLQQKTAESIARQIHDQKKRSFMFNGVETRLDEFSDLWKKLVTDAYYHLYPQEVKPSYESFIENADTLLAVLSDGSYVAYETVERDPDSDQYDAQVQRWTMNADQFQVSQILATVPLEEVVVYSFVVTASADSQLLAFGYKDLIRIYQKNNNDQFNQIQEIPIDDTRCSLLNMALSNETLVIHQLVGEGQTEPALRSKSELLVYTLDAARNQFGQTQVIAYKNPDLVTDTITSISFDARGDYFVSASYDVGVKIWSRDSRTMQFALQKTLIPIPSERHRNDGGRVLLSPSNTFLAWGQKNSVVIWKIVSQGEFTQVQDFQMNSTMGGVYNLSFNDESNRLVVLMSQRRYMTNNEFVIFALNTASDRWQQVYTQLGRYRMAAFVHQDFMYAENLVGQGSAGTELWWIPNAQDIWDHILLGLE
jgi:hypothetical protein